MGNYYIMANESCGLENVHSVISPSQLAYIFRPILYLHSEENFFPSTIEYIFENSELYSKGKKVTRKGIVNNSNIFQYQHNFSPPLQFKIEEKCCEGNRDLNNVPYYYKTYDIPKYVVIQYVFIYPYNGAYLVFGKKYGQHQFDLEHVSVFVNKVTLQVDKIYYGAHRSRDGQWVDKKDIEFEDERPVVYSAKHSHGCYWKPSVWYRVFGLANDHTNRGHRWDANRVVNLELQDWNFFQGEIGNEPTAKYHDWYENENESSASFLGRFCCPW